eukprot:TRINITY_DN2287_c0_g1_i3.p1 TRINITY_DN2287_c0_g1~~TRINITY_DN2287_c0_g1_i3.p1  ORF type:complete len:376 (+),score=65.01 TRINITY_DN2287_c0_g1_i3:94-1221(+)
MMESASAVFESKQSNNPSKIISVPVVQELAKEIQFQNSHDLPKRYVSPFFENPSSLSNVLALPVIDMSIIFSQQNSESRLKELQKLSSACREWGFFQIINHGIPEDLIEKTRKLCKQFFELPLQERMKSNQAKDNHFNQGYGQFPVESEDQILDWGDALYLVVFPPDMQQKQVWPEKPDDFRNTLIDYATEAEKLGVKLMKVLEESLGVEAGTFVESCNDWMSGIRINYYPPCPRPDQTLGLTSHSDVSYITILLQDGKTPGLQIKKNDEWYTVQPLTDTIIVNLGDYMEVMSNGKYKSIEHRAVTNKMNERISMAMFCTASPHKQIQPAPALVDNMNPSIYKAISAGDYYQTFSSKRLQGKKILLDYLLHSQSG